MIGLVGIGLSAWITYRLAFRRFRREKWSERRADAYIRIVEALHNSEKFADTHIDHVETGSRVPPGKDAALRKTAQEGRDEILRAVDVGKLFLSLAALDRLKRFVSDTENIKAEGWSDYVEKDYELINTCQEICTKLAKLGQGRYD
jgi:ABC-type nitrate/sulfonate/bicarbonate transport system substrate-binding protein